MGRVSRPSQRKTPLRQGGKLSVLEWQKKKFKNLLNKDRRGLIHPGIPNHSRAIRWGRTRPHSATWRPGAAPRGPRTARGARGEHSRARARDSGPFHGRAAPNEGNPDSTPHASLPFPEKPPGAGWTSQDLLLGKKLLVETRRWGIVPFPLCSNGDGSACCYMEIWRFTKPPKRRQKMLRTKTAWAPFPPLESLHRNETFFSPVNSWKLLRIVLVTKTTLASTFLRDFH